MSSSPRSRERLLTLALLVAGLVVGGLLCEAALRLLGWRPERHRTPIVLNNQRKRLLLDCYPEDPRHYFPLDLRRPETRARFADELPEVEAVAARAPHAVLFEYNELHFRDRDMGPKPPGTLRVMVLGDSFTEGQGVREEDTLPRVLERLLAGGPRPVEVFNCGRRGHDFPKLAKAFEKVLPYEPDVLVYAMVPNDPERSDAFEAARVALDDWIVDRRRVMDPGRAAVPGGLRLFQLVDERIDGWRISRASTQWYLDLYGAPNQQGWQRTQDYVLAMRDQLAARNARLVVMTWPLLVGLDDYPFAPIERAVASFLDGAGIRHHDLRPVLRAHPADALWVHPLDRHPNELAQRLAAESVAPLVRDLLAEVAR